MNKIDRGVEYLTQEQARKYFDNRVELNRPLNGRRVDALTRDMKAGRWHYNGEPLRFNTEGKLFDGQHRLRAFLDSGLNELVFAIERGLTTESASVTDTGMKRSTAHFFQMEGRAYASQLASASRHVYNYIEYGNLNQNAPVTVSEQREILETFDELEHYVKAYSIQRLPIQFAAAGLAALHTLFRNIGPKTKADEFMEGLTSGEGLKRGDPRLAARNFITRRAWGESKSTSWVSDKFSVRAMAVVIFAWNKWRAGEDYTFVKPIKIFPVISK